MRITLMLLSALLSLSQSFAQAGFFFEPYVSYVMPYSNYMTTEAGVGLYKIEHKKHEYIEVGVFLGYLRGKTSMGLGYSYKTWETSLSSILSFGNNTETFEHFNQYIKQRTAGLSISAGYRINPLVRLSTKLELNDPKRTTTNTFPREQVGSFISPVTQVGIAYLNTQLKSNILGSPYNYFFLEFRSTILITKSLGVYAELKTNLSKPREIFSYTVEGRNFDNLDSDEPVLYNRIVTNSSFLGFSLGLSWTSEARQLDFISF